MLVIALVLAFSVMTGCNGGDDGPRVNRMRLNATLIAAEIMAENELQFTVDSWGPFYEALVAARAVRDNPNATQAQVDAAETALSQAINGLVRAFQGPLSDLIYQLSQRSPSYYTPATWVVFDAALTAARLVNENDASTEEQLTAARVALLNAMAALEYISLDIAFGPNPIAPELDVDGMDNNGEVYSAYTWAPGSFGVEGALRIRYIIGDDGLYLFLEVRDTSLFFGREHFLELATQSPSGMSAFIEDSDRVEIFLSTSPGNELQDVPQSSDIRVRVTPQGFYDVAMGNGQGAWIPYGGFELDHLEIGLLEGNNTFSQRGPVEVATPDMTDVDTGYWVEIFFSYERFAFERRNEFYVAFAQADMHHPTSPMHFGYIGNIANPQEFFMLSEHGLGTNVALEADFNRFDLEDPFWNVDGNARTPNAVGRSPFFSAITQRNHNDNPHLAFQTQVDARARFGQHGLYVAILTHQPIIVYGGPNHGAAGFGFRNDHVELRVDTNYDHQEQITDLFFFVDIASNRTIARGISNETREPGTFNHVLAMTYFGTVYGGTRQAPVVREGRMDHPAGPGERGFLFKVFIPWSALSITPEQARTTGVGLFAAAGNPNAADGGGNGIGCVIGKYAIRQNGVGNLDVVPFNAWHNYFNLIAA